MSIKNFFDSICRDLRHALRGLQRRPLFALAAAPTIALGIGATTAIFSVVNAVVIKPLPYPDSEAVVTVTHSAVTGNVRDDFPFTAQMLDRIVPQSKIRSRYRYTFAALFALASGAAAVGTLLALRLAWSVRKGSR